MRIGHLLRSHAQAAQQRAITSLVAYSFSAPGRGEWQGLAYWQVHGHGQKCRLSWLGGHGAAHLATQAVSNGTPPATFREELGTTALVRGMMHRLGGALAADINYQDSGASDIAMCSGGKHCMRLGEADAAFKLSERFRVACAWPGRGQDVSLGDLARPSFSKFQANLGFE